MLCPRHEIHPAADALRPRVWGQLGWPIRPQGPKQELNLDFKCYYQVQDHYHAQLNTWLNIQLPIIPHVDLNSLTQFCCVNDSSPVPHLPNRIQLLINP